MKKFFKLFIVLMLCIFAVGCSSNEKQCAKWKTTTTGGRDCSTIKGQYEKMYCELYQEDVKTTQECVEWK